MSVVQFDLGTIVSERRDEPQYVQSEKKEGQILFSGCGGNEGTEDVMGRLKVLDEKQENKKINTILERERGRSQECGILRSRRGEKKNMKLVIWCFVSGESQSAVVTRKERQTKAELIMVLLVTT